MGKSKENETDALTVRRGKEQRTFDILGIVIMLVLAAICLLPFIMLISASITEENYIMQHGYGLLPGKISFQAYKTLFEHPMDIFRAYIYHSSWYRSGTLNYLYGRLCDFAAGF